MKKNYFYNLLLSVANILFPIISFPYASRILGPVGIGKVQLVCSFAQYFAIIAMMGIPIYGIQVIARNRHDKKKLATAFSELMSICFISSVLLSIVYLAIIFYFPFFRSNIQLYCYAVVLILLGFSSIDWFYSGLEEFRLIALRSVVIKIILLIYLFIYVKNKEDYGLYLWLTIFSMLGNNIISVLMAGNHTSLVFKNLNLLQHVKPLLYILSMSVATSMYTILDTVLLGFLSDEKAVGLYTAAIKLTKIAIPFIISLGVVMIPKLTKSVLENNLEEMQHLLDESFHFISFFSIPLLAGLMVLAPEFVVVFSGHGFASATISMQILSSLPLLIGFGYFFIFQILLPAGKNREMFLAVITGMLVGLLLDFILIPSLKEKGAAIANVSCELVITVLSFYFVKKYYVFSYKWELLFKAIACSLLFLPIVFIIHLFEMNVIPSLLISIFLCASTYFCVQYFLFKDLFMFKTLNLIYLKLNRKNLSD
jgi:O-antigen/teichoic acid export membrane protein